MPRLGKYKDRVRSHPSNHKGEADRLIGGHLPRLVDSYCSLTLAERSAASEASQHAVQALRTFAAELEKVAARLEETKSERFGVELRFVERRVPQDSRPASQ